MLSSRNIAGFICLGLLAIPLLLSPFRSDEVNEFVRNIERRNRTDFPSFGRVKDYYSAERWEQMGRAMGDRFPLRDVVIPFKRGVEYHWLGKRRFGDVGRGRDGWLFLIPSYDMNQPSPEHALHAARATTVELDRFVADHRGRRARLIVTVAPDKVSLYPEMLFPHAWAQYEAFLPARRILQEHFAGSSAPEVLDLWTLYRAERDRSDVPTYARTGTHHAPASEIVMARAIVERAEAGLWNEAAVVHTENQPAGMDLVGAAGLSGVNELAPGTHVERAGVDVREIWLERELIADPLVSTMPEAWNKSVHVVNQSRGPRLIPGRTLIVHDSFINSALRPDIWPYFEEVSFILRTSVDNCELELAFDEYDLIVIEIVEREALVNLIRLFTPCPMGPEGVESISSKVR